MTVTFQQFMHHLGKFAVPEICFKYPTTYRNLWNQSRCPPSGGDPRGRVWAPCRARIPPVPGRGAACRRRRPPRGSPTAGEQFRWKVGQIPWSARSWVGRGEKEGIGGGLGRLDLDCWRLGLLEVGVAYLIHTRIIFTKRHCKNSTSLATKKIMIFI